MKTRRNKINLTLIGFAILAFIFLFAYANPVNALLNFLFTVKNETTAVQSISTIRTLQAQYASKRQGKFAPNFDELIRTVQLHDDFHGESPVINGYIYKMTVHETDGSKLAFYSITADPPVDGISFFPERRHYYYDSTIRTIKCTEENRQATAGDTSI